MLKAAVDSSLDHLREWMPWAHAEPQTLDEKMELLRTFRGNFDLDNDFVYGIFTRDESEAVGGTGLHTRQGEDAFEIGYWISAGRAGEGLATEATAALTRVALEYCAVDRVEIRTEPRNERSMRIPRKLGYVEEARMRRRLPMGDGDRRDVVVFTIFRDGFAGTPSASADVCAYDAKGDRVL